MQRGRIRPLIRWHRQYNARAHTHKTHKHEIPREWRFSTFIRHLPYTNSKFSVFSLSFCFMRNAYAMALLRPTCVQCTRCSVNSDCLCALFSFHLFCPSLTRHFYRVCRSEIICPYLLPFIDQTAPKIKNTIRCVCGLVDW